jgi:hypothetical protein
MGEVLKFYAIECITRKSCSSRGLGEEFAIVMDINRELMRITREGMMAWSLVMPSA